MTDPTPTKATFDWKVLAGVASLFRMLGGGVASSVLFIVNAGRQSIGAGLGVAVARAVWR